MRDREDLLGQLAGAIADRTPIDWAAVGPRLTVRSREELITALRSIDLVATRSWRADLSTTVARSGAAALPGWIVAIAAACVAAVLAGVAGALLGVPDAGVVPIGLLVATGCVFGAMGVWLLVVSADRRGATLGAWFLSMAAIASYRPMQWLVPVLQDRFPLPALVSGWVPEVAMPVLLALFVSEFPRVARWSAAERAVNLATHLSWAAAACCAIGHVVAAVANPVAPQLSPTLGWIARTHGSQTYWLTLLTPAALSLVLMLARRHHAEGDERRRGSLFMIGLTLGIAPILVLVLLSALMPSFRHALDDRRNAELVALLVYGSALSIPFTTAYAIRAHRILSVRFVLRGTVRRLLARSTLSVATLVPAVLLAVHMLKHREESLSALFAGSQSLLSLALTALGLLGIATRGPLVRCFDRTLMARRGDARASLFRANQNLRHARSVEEALDVLLREIETTLGARGRVLIGGSDGYVSRDGRIPAIPGGSALARLVLSADGPLLVDPLTRESVFPWLPDVERARVVASGVAVLLPIAGGPGHRALLALEAPRDGDPYSSEDFLYLGALATAGGMALESAMTDRSGRLAPLGEAEDVAGECRSCGRVLPSRSSSCSCGSPLEPALLPHVLSGKFRLMRRLGSGAMGVVYQAEDLDLGRTVALKTLPRLSPELALRLRREARSMARVLHPRLAMIFGCEEWRGVPVLVLEHLAGTLSCRVGRPWGIREALDVGIAVAEGLAVMHDNGLLHRDVKPSNVGVSHAGEVKLLDFGIAHLLAVDVPTLDAALSARPTPTSTDMDLSNRVVGTPLYCSPERLEGAPAGPADDVWSLSVLLYELLAGRHPWRTGDVVIKAPGLIPSLAGERRDCPPEVARFFSRALGRRARERPATATALRSELLVLIEGHQRPQPASA